MPVIALPPPEFCTWLESQGWCARAPLFYSAHGPADELKAGSGLAQNQWLLQTKTHTQNIPDETVQSGLSDPLNKEFF